MKWDSPHEFPNGDTPRCCAVTTSGAQCKSDATNSFGPVNICNLHGEYVRSAAIRYSWDKEKFFADAKAEKRYISTRKQKKRREALKTWNSRDLVYYMRRGNYIKIGHSINPELRRLTIQNRGGVKFPDDARFGPIELLATEKGGHNQEKAMHSKFHSYHAVGEWFHATPELLTHIDVLISSDIVTK